MSQPIEARESMVERAIAFILCVLVLLVPMIYIEHGYDAFTSEHGEAREGAAGAGLALASYLEQFHERYYEPSFVHPPEQVYEHL